MLKKIAIFSDNLHRAIRIMDNLLEHEEVIDSNMYNHYYEATTINATFATEVYNPRMFGMRYHKIWIDSESNVTKEIVSKYLWNDEDLKINTIEFYILQE